MIKIHLHNMDQLRREKDRLKMMIELKEREIALSADHVKHHYKGMIWDSINPFSNREATGGLLKAVLPGLAGMSIDDIKKGKFNDEPLIALTAGLLTFLAKKIMHRKTEKKEEAKD